MIPIHSHARHAAMLWFILSSEKDYTLAYLEHFTEISRYRPPFHKLIQQVIELGWVKLASGQNSFYELTIKGIITIPLWTKWLPVSGKANS